ncbi:hypothetical protein ACFL04_02660 [Patescibacteria group bacterium]
MNDKKYMPGFVPVRYRVTGTILLATSGIVLVLMAIDAIFGWPSLPTQWWYIGIALMLIGLYLVFVVPKE